MMFRDVSARNSPTDSTLLTVFSLLWDYLSEDELLQSLWVASFFHLDKPPLLSEFPICPPWGQAQTEHGGAGGKGHHWLFPLLPPLLF